EPALHGALRHAERGGDLVATHSFHFAQHQDRAVVAGAPEQRGLYALRGFAARHALEGRRALSARQARFVVRVQLLERHGAIAPPAPPPALPVPALIDRDAVDPGLEAAAALEAAERPEHLQEHVLGQIARLLAVAQQALREIHDHAFVERDEAGERKPITTEAAGNQPVLESDDRWS